MPVICRGKASTTSWETFSSMGRSKSFMDVSNITESNITDSMITDIHTVFYTRQNLIATQSLLTPYSITITIIIIIIKILLRQLEAVLPQSWPTILQSKSRFVAMIKLFMILLVSMLLIYYLYGL